MTHYCKICRNKFYEEGDTITVSLSSNYTCGNCGVTFNYR